MFRRNWTSRLNSQAAQTAESKVGTENEAELGGEKKRENQLKMRARWRRNMQVEVYRHKLSYSHYKKTCNSIHTQALI